jgi:hypothetical protein
MSERPTSGERLPHTRVFLRKSAETHDCKRVVKHSWRKERKEGRRAMGLRQLYFLTQSAERIEKKRVEFLEGAKKRKRVRKQQEAKETDEVKEVKEWRAAGRMGRLGDALRTGRSG